MAETYPRCPSCGFNKDDGFFGGLLTGSYFNIFRCYQCEHLFCYKCGQITSGILPLVTTDVICPKCGSDGYKVGECYLA